MTTGYFHYRKPSQALTVYYEIYPSDGILKYSCSLWRKNCKVPIESLFIDGYDQNKLDVLKQAIENRGNNEFIHINTCKPVQKSDEAMEFLQFNAKTGICFRQEKTQKETNSKLKKIKQMLLGKLINDVWDRKQENAHAKANFENEFVTHTFPKFEQGDLKLDDVWLKKYIHKHICNHGRKRNLFLSNDIQSKGYRTVEQCYNSRGHELPDWINPQTGLPKLLPDDDQHTLMLMELLSHFHPQEEEEVGILEQLVKWWYAA